MSEYRVGIGDVRNFLPADQAQFKSRYIVPIDVYVLGIEPVKSTPTEPGRSSKSVNIYRHFA